MTNHVNDWTAGVSSGASGSVSTAAAVPATNGVIFTVRSYPGTSGANPDPGEIPGFVRITSVTNTNSTTIVREDAYRARGAGAIITATTPAVANVARTITLTQVDGIDRDNFVEAFTSVASNANTAGPATVSLPASAYPNAMVIGALGFGTSAGGTGTSWDAGFNIAGGGATNSYAVQGVLKPTAGVQSLSATWTTAGVWALIGLLLGGDSAAPLATPNVTLVSKTDPTTVGGTDGKATVSWPAVTGAVSYRVEVAEGASATSGFTVKSETATSPYQVTGLADGTYTIAVTAKP